MISLTRTSAAPTGLEHIRRGAETQASHDAQLRCAKGPSSWLSQSTKRLQPAFILQCHSRGRTASKCSCWGCLERGPFPARFLLISVTQSRSYNCSQLLFFRCLGWSAHWLRVFLSPLPSTTLFSLLNANYGRIHQPTSLDFGMPDAGRFPVPGREQALGLISWAAHYAWRHKAVLSTGGKQGSTLFLDTMVWKRHREARRTNRLQGFRGHIRGRWSHLENRTEQSMERLE